MAAEDFNLREHIKGVAVRLESAAHGEQTALIKAEADFLGIKPQTLYRRLQKMTGWSSGRKARADKGVTSQNLEAAKFVAAIQKTSIRKNGKVTMHVPTAASIAHANGHDISVSPSRLGRILKERRLDVGTQARAKAFTRMRSLYPNHVHQVDPSLCLIYYMKGHQYIIRDDQFYKNKLENVAKIKLKVWRYVLFDHCSSSLIPWYVEARGESQANLFEFLMFAWGRQPGRPNHGVPEILMMDKGSANGAHAIKNLCRHLGVKVESHLPGNARAKGGVEGGNNLVETHFECRLKAEPVDTVEQLNAAALAWANAWNADLIPMLDCRLHRKGVTPVARTDIWLDITAAQLRFLPAVETCRALLEGKTATRKVNGLQITFKHPQAEFTQAYDLSGCDGVCDGDMVEISPLLYGRCAVIVKVSRFDGEPVEYVREPIEVDARGFPVEAPVWGEGYQSKPDTDSDVRAKELDRIAYPDRDLKQITRAKDKNEVPFGGTVDAFSHLQKIDMPAYLAKRGTDLNVPNRIEVEIKPLNHIQVAMKLSDIFGRPPTSIENTQLREWYPDGVLEELLQAVADRLEGKALEQAPRLAIVK